MQWTGFNYTQAGIRESMALQGLFFCACQPGGAAHAQCVALFKCISLLNYINYVCLTCFVIQLVYQCHDRCIVAWILRLVRELLAVIIGGAIAAFTAYACNAIGLITFQCQVAIPAITIYVQSRLYSLLQTVVGVFFTFATVSPCTSG